MVELLFLKKSKKISYEIINKENMKKENEQFIQSLDIISKRRKNILKQRNNSKRGEPAHLLMKESIVHTVKYLCLCALFFSCKIFISKIT